MQTKFTQIREKIEVRMLMAVGGTTLLAFIVGAGVIISGPGHP